MNNRGISAEAKLKIAVPGTRLRIHGRLCARERPGLNVLFIFAHGLGSHMNDGLFVNCARELDALGYSSYRFNACGEDLDERRNYSISTQAHDLDLAVQHFKEVHTGFSRPPLLVAVGHCMGALALLTSARLFDAAVMVSHGTIGLGGALGPPNPDIAEPHTVNWSLPFQISPQMVREYQSFDVLDHCRRFTVPTFGVNGYDDIERLQARIQIAAIDHPDKRVFEIDNADHWFSSPDAVQALIHVLATAGERVKATAQLESLLGREAIEDHWQDVLRIIARRSKHILRSSDATTQMSQLVSEAFARRMKVLGTLQSRQEQYAEPGSTTRDVRLKELRAELHEALSNLVRVSRESAPEELVDRWSQAVLGRWGIARLACEISETLRTADTVFDLTSGELESHQV